MPATELKAEFLKSRGVATFDDDDDAENIEPRRDLESHHELVVQVVTLSDDRLEQL